MRRTFRFLLLIACVLPLDAALADRTCQPGSDLTPLCIGHAAEDIEALPDGHHLLLSNYHSWDGSVPGTLVLLDTDTQKTETLYPSAAENTFAAWGDPNCRDALGAAISPHGMHLSRRSDGNWQLLVVNHGRRESVEFFEVLPQPSGYRLQWRGCVSGPAGSFFNDVAAMPDHGFVVTQMLDKRDTTAMARAARGEPTGHVLHWSPTRGFEKVAGSEGCAPNGVQSTADGKTIFVNFSGTGDVRKVDVASGKNLGSLKIRQPDNVSWTADGRLLEISQLQPMDFTTCAKQTSGFCDIAFAVYSVDPATMHAQKIFEHAGAPFGAATVAVQMGGDIFLGTFAGDRLAKFPAPATDHDHSSTREK